MYVCMYVCVHACMYINALTRLLVASPSGAKPYISISISICICIILLPSMADTKATLPTWRSP